MNKLIQGDRVVIELSDRTTALIQSGSGCALCRLPYGTVWQIINLDDYREDLTSKEDYGFDIKRVWVLKSIYDIARFMSDDISNAIADCVWERELIWKL